MLHISIAKVRMLLIEAAFLAQSLSKSLKKLKYIYLHFSNFIASLTKIQNCWNECPMKCRLHDLKYHPQTLLRLLRQCHNLVFTVFVTYLFEG